MRKKNIYRRYALAGMTASCAISIGFLMQSSQATQAAHAPQGPATLHSPLQATTASLSSGSATPGSAAPRVLPFLPGEETRAAKLPDQPVVLLVSRDTPVADMPIEEATPTLSCDAELTAVPTAAAMVDLTLVAPCLTGERVTVHHDGLKFTEQVGEDGSLTVTVPALSEQAVFIMAFPSGAGAIANTTVNSLSFYNRVAVMWQGDAGLELHAREFSADYGTDGHVWRDAPRDMSAVLGGAGGFLMRLGRRDLPKAHIAEVYTFPSASAQTSGDILLSLEAEISSANCGRRIAAQSIELEDGIRPRTREIDLTMPDCDATGGFLVLKNLLEDLKIARN